MDVGKIQGLIRVFQERCGRTAASWRARVWEVKIDCFVVGLSGGGFVVQYVVIEGVIFG